MGYVEIDILELLKEEKKPKKVFFKKEKFLIKMEIDKIEDNTILFKPLAFWEDEFQISINNLTEM